MKKVFTTGQVANDMVLGTSSYQNGERTNQFAFSDKGIGLLKGVVDQTTTVRSVYIDGPTAEAITAQARAHRAAAGLLSGYAAGLDVTAADVDATDTLLPDIAAVIRAQAARGVRDLVVMPLGFVCDHVEVLYDLDIEAKQIADALGIGFTRAPAVNDHPSFIRMLAAVIGAHARR